ncbi:MAG: hypothetical protein CL676_08550 [Bdellovibrionaceae bacterium]|nr:hypothetical protein [Pseudobdellovibrionaceae bacterium]|tara:strand:- start:11136 stop:12137 length:1002 start_codon:yes stop_codon:yes gene_type:complete
MRKLLLVGLMIFAPNLFATVNLEDVDAALRSEEGLKVEIHGADHDSNLYVIAVRGDNFFDAIQIPFVADYNSINYREVKKIIAGLHRHDFVRIRGQINGKINTPQAHILVKSIEVLSDYDGGFGEHPPYEHNTQLPRDLQNKSQAIFKVHAVVPSGPLMILEYGDVNVPVIVPVELTSQIAGLYRGDKVEMQYELARSPKSPSHLVMKSLRVLDALVEQHGTPIHHCGELVMFPKSPQVKFNVFAIKKDIGDNLFRTYTLINFDDVDLFLAFRAKAQKAWDAQVSTAVRGRNYYINDKIEACATGKVNMIDPTQANPQIVIERLEDLNFRALP